MVKLILVLALCLLIFMLVSLLFLECFPKEHLDNRVNFYAVTSEIGRKPQHYPYINTSDLYQYL